MRNAFERSRPNKKAMQDNYGASTRPAPDFSSGDSLFEGNSRPGWSGILAAAKDFLLVGNACSPGSGSTCFLDPRIKYLYTRNRIESAARAPRGIPRPKARCFSAVWSLEGGATEDIELLALPIVCEGAVASGGEVFIWVVTLAVGSPSERFPSGICVTKLTGLSRANLGPVAHC